MWRRLDTPQHAHNATTLAHPSGTGKLKKMLPGTKSVLSEVSGGKADVKFCDGEKIHFGSRSVNQSGMVYAPRSRVPSIRSEGFLAAGVTRVVDSLSLCLTLSLPMRSDHDADAGAACK